MTAQRVYGITRMSAKTRLPVPSIRYWAEMYGGLIGAERLSHGGWRFNDEAVRFFATVATEQTRAAAQAGAATDDRGDTQCDAQVDAQAGARVDTEADAIRAQLATLTTRTEHLSLHIEDLAEETKQLQLLLTRIIALLAPTSSVGTREKTVRPWHPPPV